MKRCRAFQLETGQLIECVRSVCRGKVSEGAATADVSPWHASLPVVLGGGWVGNTGERGFSAHLVTFPYVTSRAQRGALNCVRIPSEGQREGQEPSSPEQALAPASLSKQRKQLGCLLCGVCRCCFGASPRQNGS